MLATIAPDQPLFQRRALIEAIVPRSIARTQPMQLPEPLSEAQALAELRTVAARNQVLKSFIGQGYHATHTPGVILRNVLENPAWYTAYTPYQAEISQGRMEALVNFQTMVTDLTGMAIANASMLDEATSAAEAMTLALRVGTSRSQRLLVAHDVLPQTLEVLRTRAQPLGITVDQVHATAIADEIIAGPAFAVLLQYPGVTGQVRDLRPIIDAVHGAGALAIVAADLLALCLLVRAGRTRRRHRGRHHPALRHADGQRRTARGLHRDARRIQALAAGPAGRRERRCAWQPGVPAGAADPRAAHPAREGDLEHLHRPGAAGGRCQHVRGLPRSGRSEANRPPGCELCRDPGRWAAPARLPAAARHRLRHAAGGGRRPPRRAAGRRAGRRDEPARGQCRHASASRSTRRPRAPT